MPKKVNETLDMGGAARITNLPAASASTEPVRKNEFDAMKAGINWLPDVRAVETGNINKNSPGATHDGVTLANGDRILLTGQTTASQNGIWVYNGASSALTRPASDPTMTAGSAVISGPDGTNQSNSMWIQTTDNPVVDTTALTFTRIAFTLTAGTGLALTGNVMALTTPVALANGGTGSGTASGARSNLNTPGKFTQLFGDGAASDFNIPHSLGNQWCAAVKVINVSTLQEEDCTITFTDANNLHVTSEGWAASPPGNNAYRITIDG